MAVQQQSIEETKDIKSISISVHYDQGFPTVFRINGNDTMTVCLSAQDLCGHFHNLMDTRDTPITTEAAATTEPINMKARWVVQKVKQIQELKDKIKYLERLYEVGIDTCEDNGHCPHCNYAKECYTKEYIDLDCGGVLRACIEAEVKKELGME